MTERTISSSSRNLGYAWTNLPVRVHNPNGSTSLGFKTPEHPEWEGGLKTIEAARDEAFRLNKGNDWAEAMFVGGERIVEIYTFQMATADPESVVEDWFRFGNTKWEIGELLSMLRDGYEYHVRTAPAEELAHAA